jgi:hypothetical protein
MMWLVVMMPLVIMAVMAAFRSFRLATGNWQLATLGLEPRGRPALPVGALLGSLTFQVQNNHLGQELAMAAVPLQGELDVGPRRVTVVERIPFQVKPAVNRCGAVPELEEADGHIAMRSRHVTSTDWGPRRETLSAAVPVIVPSSAVPNRSPRIPSDDTAPVDAVDRSFVEVRPFEILAKAMREDDVGVKVNNPILTPNLVNCPLDQPGLVKQPTPAMFLGEHVADRHFLAHPARLVVVGRGHDNEIVDQNSGDASRFRKEVAVSHTNCDCLDSQSDSPVTSCKSNRGSALPASSRSHEPSMTIPKPEASNWSTKVDAGFIKKSSWLLVPSCQSDKPVAFARLSTSNWQLGNWQRSVHIAVGIMFDTLVPPDCPVGS